MAGNSELHVRHRSHQPDQPDQQQSEPLHSDDSVCYPQDDNYGFFAKGRDFESAFVNHRYTQEERKTLSSYNSLDYLPSHSTVYQDWVKRQPPRLDWDRWIMMGLIGFTVGFIGFLLHQVIDVISDFKWRTARQFIDENDLVKAWGFVLGYSVLFVIVSSALVVFIRPSAAGSGIPEVIGFLNGTIVRHIFNVKTMLVKFFSCCCAVGSGLPVGPEGPMIHLGSLVGAGMSQFRSRTLRFQLPFFERFRNSEDRRNFISAGAAAGVASAFGAPVGGLLFSMEEVSSFWNMKLSWQIFFCAMVSTFTTDLFNSAFTGFRYQGQFGMFKAEKYILFEVDSEITVNILAFIPAVILGEVDSEITVNILAFIPAVILGVVGGVLGALFTFINLKIARVRKRILSHVKGRIKQAVLKLIEPVIIMMIVASVSVFLPAAFPCSEYSCIHGVNQQLSPQCLNDSRNPLHTEPTVERYTCPEGIVINNDTYTWTNDTYNQMATLLFVNGEEAIHHLFSRNTHLEFDYPALVTALVFYFTMACWSAGTAVSSGIVVPMLFIGGLYGRILGRGLVDLFGVHVGADSYWSWMDPGAFALVGAASFFGGVSRLTMSLTVIMMEITNEVQFLLPIMATIMVAKWIGDFITHPLYHALLELKCIPFLDAEPVIMNSAKQVVNLELFKASDVMTSPVLTCHVTESVHMLAHLLESCSHGGFPVVRGDDQGGETFFGFISRLDLLVLLKNEDLFKSADDIIVDESPLEVTTVDYQDIINASEAQTEAIAVILSMYTTYDRYKELYLNLEPYVNQSAVTVPAKFSLHRTYIIFRTLGLRHLTVVNENNGVVGIVTRKDLMGFSMEEKLGDRMDMDIVQVGTNVELPEFGGGNYPT